MPHQTIRVEVPIDGDNDLELLRGALLAAKATELGEARRRSPGAKTTTGPGRARAVA